MDHDWNGEPPGPKRKYALSVIKGAKKEFVRTERQENQRSAGNYYKNLAQMAPQGAC